MPAPWVKFRVFINILQELNGPSLRNPQFSDYIRLLSAAGLWGSSFLLNEIALADFAPVAVASYRIIIATVVVCLVCYAKRLTTVLDRRTLQLFLAIGLLNSVVPFSLIGWGQLRIDSSTTAILLATSPFVTLLMSHYMTTDDRFSWQKLTGLLFGFAGVLVLLGQGFMQGEGSVGGMLAVVLAAACYSLSSLLIRRLGTQPSLVIVAGTLLASCVVVVPVLLIFFPPWQQAYHAPTLSALLFLSVGPTAVAYVLRAQIVQLNGAVFMSNVGYLIPLFAVLWGWLFLRQQPSVVLWLALGLILMGVALGQRRANR